MSTAGRNKQPQVRLRRPEVRQIECDQVVAENEGRAVGKFVEPRERGCRSAAGMLVASVSAHGAEDADAAVRLADLKVERQAAGFEGFAGYHLEGGGTLRRSNGFCISTRGILALEAESRDTAGITM